MAKRKNDFDEFMREVGEESAAAGETPAVAAHAEHFRLALAVIQLRKKRRWTQQQIANWQPTHPGLLKDLDRGHYFDCIHR